MISTQGHPQHVPSTPSHPKRVAFGAAMVLLLVVIAEVGSYVMIHVSRPYLDGEIRTTRSIYREQTWQLQRLVEPDPVLRDQFDPHLGWRHRPGYVGPGDRINSAGLRGDRSYLPEATDDVLRVAAFGDSFVYGMEVGYRDSWGWHLEQADDDLELLNYGVGGYGTDQSLLRYRAEGDDFDPEIVLIGFAPVNLGRNVNRYRRFLSTRETVWVKPRFRLTVAGELELIPSPIRSLGTWHPYIDDPQRVREFGVHDQWYEALVYENPFYDLSATIRLASNVYLRTRDRYFGSERMLEDGTFRTVAPAYEVTRALLEQFVAEVHADSAQPIIIMLPDLRSVLSARDGAPTVYAPLVESMRERFQVWDLVEPFVLAPAGVAVDEWFMPGGHYAPSANAMIAQWMRPRVLNARQDVEQ